MKLLIALAAAGLYLTFLNVGSPSATHATSALPQATASKTQPVQTTLAKDSQSDKWGEVAFNHDTHSTKNYSPDGKSVIACIDCHHTDQPKSSLKPPYSTSERDTVLTTPSLADDKALPVKSCRSCHGQKGDDSVQTPAKSDGTKLFNDVAYHQNCNVCHDAANTARPELKAKGLPGSNDCGKCHKPLT
jgi:hypothetical protein